MYASWGPGFAFSLPGGGLPLLPVSYATAPDCLHLAYRKTNKGLFQLQEAEMGVFGRVHGVTHHDKVRICEICKTLNEICFSSNWKDLIIYINRLKLASVSSDVFHFESFVT